MCRSIKTLRRPAELAGPAEIEAAALQYVRKVSGYRQPAQRNAEAFAAAVREVDAATRRLLEALQRADHRRPLATPTGEDRGECSPAPLRRRGPARPPL
jgi:hypothetical protein